MTEQQFLAGGFSLGDEEGEGLECAVMKTFAVEEAQAQLGQLIAEANDGNVIVLTDGSRRVTLQPGAARNLEEDSPELEAELLGAIEGPYTPYSVEEMRGIVERIIREEARG